MFTDGGGIILLWKLSSAANTTLGYIGLNKKKPREALVPHLDSCLNFDSGALRSARLCANKCVCVCMYV